MHITQREAQAIVNEMKAAIHRDLNIMDEHGIILASTNPARQGQLHQGALMVIEKHLPCFSIWKDDAPAGVQRGINLPIMIDETLEGVIGITGNPDEVSVFGDVIKRMTEVMMESTYQREQFNLLERSKCLFVENWLFSETADWAELRIRGRLLKIDIEEPYTIALLAPMEPGPDYPQKPQHSKELRSSLILRMAQSCLSDNPNHFCAVMHDEILILLHQADQGATYAKISSICRTIDSFYSLQLKAGIGNGSSRPQDIRRCYAEAKAALRVAERSIARNVVCYDQVSLEFIAQSIPQEIRQNLSSLVFSRCTPEEQVEFQQAIRLFFDQDGDIRKCADQLFIHRNTFQYRITQIKKATGYDLRVPKDALTLYLALSPSD